MKFAGMSIGNMFATQTYCQFVMLTKGTFSLWLTPSEG